MIARRYLICSTLLKWCVPEKSKNKIKWNIKKNQQNCLTCMSIGSNVYLTFFFLYVFIIPHHLLHSTIGCVLLRWMDFVFAFRCFTGGYDYFCFKLPYTLTNTMYKRQKKRRIPIDHVLFSFKTMNRINMFFILPMFLYLS